MLAAKVLQWESCDQATKEGARQAFLQALMSPVRMVAHTAAQVLAAYGKVDLPKGDFDALLPQLNQCMQSDLVSEGTKIATLECMGYLCESLDPDEDEIKKESVDQILTAIIVNGMHESKSIAMRTAATEALGNTLVFAQANFEDPSGNERNMIMESIRSAMVCMGDEKVRELAYQCLGTVAENYYDFLGQYIEGIYGLSVNAIRTDEESVGSMAIEFWAIIAESEIDRNDDLEDGVPNDEVKHQYIMQKVCPNLVPVILETFDKMDEDEDDSDQRISISGHLFLEKMSLCVGNHVVSVVLPYVQKNIQSTNWCLRDGAVSAFGFILDGPSEAVLSPYIQQAFPTLIQLTQDQNEHVAVSALWTVAKVCEFHKAAIPPASIQPLIGSIISALERESPRVQGKACLAVHNLAAACDEAADLPTNLLSAFFDQVLRKILHVAASYANNDQHTEVLLNAYEAANMMIQNSAVDVLPTVRLILDEALARLEGTMQGNMGLTSQQKMALHGYLAALIGTCIQKFEGTQVDDALADRTMGALLQVCSDTNSSALQDAYMSIGFMIDRLEDRYLRYAPTVVPYVFAALEKQDDYATCYTAVGVFGDMCRAIGDKIAPYCDSLMEKLFALLQSSTVAKVVKPHVISLFSDVAMAIETHFERYAVVVMGILGKAVDSAKLSKDRCDEDHDEFVYTIRESIMEAYTGIIIGLADANKQDMISAHVEKIMTFVIECCTPEDDLNRPDNLHKTAIGVLGDLCKAYGAKIAQPMSHQAIQAVVQKALISENTEVSSTARWVHQIFQQMQIAR